jgi:hypothetical protein
MTVLMRGGGESSARFLSGTSIPHLLDQIDADVASLTADGAYYGEAFYDTVSERYSGAAVIIAPRVATVIRGTTSTQRDRHIATITKHGRMGLQRRSPSRARSAQSADRVEDRIQCAQPDDGSRHAGVRPGPMTRMPREEDATLGLLHAPMRVLFTSDGRLVSRPGQWP